MARTKGGLGGFPGMNIPGLNIPGMDDGGGGNEPKNSRAYFSRSGAKKDGKDPMRDMFGKPGFTARLFGVTDDFNADAFQSRLNSDPVNDKDFYLFHSILSHPKWSVEDKALAIRKAAEYGYDMNRGLGEPPQVPLDRAIRMGKPLLVQALLRSGARADYMNHLGENAVSVAVQNDDPQILSTVLAHTPLRSMVLEKTGTSANFNGDSLSMLALKRAHMTKATDPTGAFDNLYTKLSLLKQHGVSDEEILDLKKEIRSPSSGMKWDDKELNILDSLLDTAVKVPNLPPEYREQPFKLKPTNLNTELEDIRDADNTPGMAHGAVNMIFSPFFKLNETDRRLSESVTGHMIRDAIRDGFDDGLMRYIEKHRNYNGGAKIMIDHVLGNKKQNPHGDTLFSAAVRQNSWSSVRKLLSFNPNLHALDLHGDSVLHILAKNPPADRNELMNAVSLLAGRPEVNEKGEVSRAYMDGYKGDPINLLIPNAEGKTFIDILRDKDPELAKQVASRFRLKIQDPTKKPEIPTWSIEEVRMAGGPQLFQQQITYEDPFKGKTIPAPEELLSSATPEARGQYLTHTAYALDRIQNRISNSNDVEETKYLQSMFDQYLNVADVETRVGLTFEYLSKSNLTPNEEKTYKGILSHLMSTMRSGTDEEKKALFEVYERASEDTKLNLLNVVAQDAVLNHGDDNGLQKLASQYYNALEQEISKKYGDPNFQNDSEIGSSQQAKPNDR